MRKIAAGRNYRLTKEATTLDDLNIPNFVGGKPAKEYFDENDAHVILEKDNTGLFPNMKLHVWAPSVEVITQDGRSIKGSVLFSLPSEGAIIVIPKLDLRSQRTSTR